MEDNLLKGHLFHTPELHQKGIVCCENGFTYDLLNFSGDMVDKDFIINSLSKIPRYLGHYCGNKVYSVGQHSVKMAEAILLFTGDPELAREALWHDSSEAYLGDMIKPLKDITPLFKEIELKLEAVIFKTLGLKFPQAKEVKQVDINICEYEISFLLNPVTTTQTLYIWCIEQTLCEFRAMESRLLHLINLQK